MKCLDIPVQNAVRVGGLVLRPVILHQTVRMKHVGPYLTPQPISSFEILNRLKLLPFLGQLQFIKPRPQDLPGHFTVPYLRPFILAGNHDSCRNVRDANGRVGDVDVLAAGAPKNL